MNVVTSPSDLPKVPAVYALYGGQGRARHVAYVGVASTSLRSRIEQHLVRRDSSVTTGVSAASLNPEHVTGLAWWEREDFAEKDALHAAELVAFDVLGPALRSRGGVRNGAKELYEDESFREGLAELFGGEPSGRMEVLTLGDALERIAQLQRRVEAVEAKLSEIGTDRK